MTYKNPFRKLTHDDLIVMTVIAMEQDQPMKVMKCPYCGQEGLQLVKGVVDGLKRSPWVGEDENGKLFAHRCQQMKDYFNQKYGDKYGPIGKD